MTHLLVGQHNGPPPGGPGQQHRLTQHGQQHVVEPNNHQGDPAAQLMCEAIPHGRWVNAR